MWSDFKREHSFVETFISDFGNRKKSKQYHETHPSSVCGSCDCIWEDKWCKYWLQVYWFYLCVHLNLRVCACSVCSGVSHRIFFATSVLNRLCHVAHPHKSKDRWESKLRICFELPCNSKHIYPSKYASTSRSWIFLDTLNMHKKAREHIKSPSTFHLLFTGQASAFYSEGVPVNINKEDPVWGAINTIVATPRVVRYE